MSPTGILLSDDLLFTSRISGTARDLGLDLKVARAAAELGQLLKAQPPACVIVDLHHAELNLATLVPELRQLGRSTLVGYGSHVATEVLKQARTAGCDVVMPRSQFVERLAEDLPKWYAEKHQPDA
jgi:ActR/RegA family two-component response regulator